MLCTSFALIVVYVVQELPISSGPARSPAHIAANMEDARAELLAEGTGS